MARGSNAVISEEDASLVLCTGCLHVFESVITLGRMIGTGVVRPAEICMPAVDSPQSWPFIDKLQAQKRRV